MGSSYDEERERRGKYTQTKIIKAWITSLGSFLISMVGGLILIFWEIKYHPSNSQLWMVPIGLIFFVTPVLVCLAAFISDTFTTVAATTPPPSSELSSLKQQSSALCQELAASSSGNSESCRSHHMLNI